MLRPFGSVSVFVLVLTIAALCSGCGAAASSGPVVPGVTRASHMCAVRREIHRAFRTNASSEKSTASRGPRRASIGSGPSAQPFAVAFSIAAPATAIVRAADGFGSGVVIDRERGLVLTNFHVVERAQNESFGFRVKVEFGRLLENGRMARDEQTFDGIVVKADPVRDLAIVKVENRPDDLVEVKIAERPPHVGDPVLAVGQAGLGMLWGARVCHVADVGDPIEDTSLFAALDCSIARPDDDPQEISRHASECEQTRERIRSFLEHTQQGLAIQTNCSLMQGDSGGPLVDTHGDLVGLNQSVRDMASLHVHRDEIADFVRDIPQTPLVFLPDPFCEGVPNIVLEDADLDGKVDTIAAASSGYVEDSWSSAEAEINAAFFFDIDQDEGKKADPSTGVPFDAEVAFVQRGRTLYVYYDTDDDGRFDALVVDKRGDGKVDRGYRISKTGTIKLDEPLGEKYVFDSSLLPPHVDFGRFSAMVHLIGRAHNAEPSLSSAFSEPPPDKLAMRALGDGYVWDWDGDDIVDSLVTVGVFGRTRLFDRTGQSFQGMRSGDSAAELIEHPERLRPTMTFILRGDSAFAQYDEDRDGTVDVVSVGPRNSLDFLVATRTLRLEEGSAPVEIAEAEGRLLLRPAFADLDEPPASIAFAAAPDDGLGSFPDLRKLDSTMFRFDAGEDGVDKYVLSYRDRDSVALLFDLDRSTKEVAWTSASDLAETRIFDAELAVFFHRGLAWAFYDTDNDRRFDLVFFQPVGDANVKRAFRVRADGRTELMVADREQTKLIQPKRFSFIDPRRVREIVEEHVDVSMVEIW
ncbi:MAG: trypsin-like peptidase domain-containing protein [Polyangiaceae bacterium]|nr:trypsin-like peptidase domain-containing protein [Polyangiaceae bacterium]